MSGPLSSTEIEDVVSSVRRLVSVDARPRPVSRDLGLDKLILTPALRVVSEPTSPEPLILEEVKARTAQAQPAPAGSVSADTVQQVVESEWEDEIWQEDGPPLAELALAVEEAELIQAVEQIEEAPNLAWSEAEPVPEAHWAQVDEGWSEVEPETPPVTPVPLQAEGVAEPARKTGKSSRTKTEGEARTRNVPLPEPEPVMTAQQGDAQTLVDKDGNPLTVLDEDALHEIVRALIREELQGVLGERITRNVRKLVRAEINRALTARSLD
jgi:hypothetical protein